MASHVETTVTPKYITKYLDGPGRLGEHVTCGFSPSRSLLSPLYSVQTKAVSGEACPSVAPSLLFLISLP